MKTQWLSALWHGKRFEIIIVLLILCVFLGQFTTPVQDGDLYWHLQSGEWIARHGTLPTADPFSHAQIEGLTSQESLQQQFTLTQYWLGQLVLYGIWSVGGIPGIVLFRAVIYIAILVFLFAWMTRRQSGYAPLVLVFFVGNLLCSYPNERPQLFSFLFFPIVLFLLESLRHPRSEKLSPAVIFLPLLMLLWANMHGAFLLGLLMVTIYLGVALLSGNKPKNFGLILGCILTLAISWLNPNGWNGFLLLFQSATSAYQPNLVEYLSPWRAALDLKEFFPWYWSFAGLFLVVLVLKRKELEPATGVVFLVLLFLSLNALRHMIYLLLAAPLMVSYLGHWKINGKTFKITMVVVLAFWWGTRDHVNVFSFGEHLNFPKEAVRFINDEKIKGNFFNLYDWGGYIGLNAGKKNFIDGRGLFNKVSADYDTAINAESTWRDILIRYNVHALILPGVQLGGGGIYPLVRTLYFDSSWKLVYHDHVALIFVKDDELNQSTIAKFNTDKRNIYEHILMRADWILRDPNFSRQSDLLLTMGDTALFLGYKDRAFAAYRQVLETDPDNMKAKRMLGLPY